MKFFVNNKKFINISYNFFDDGLILEKKNSKRKFTTKFKFQNFIFKRGLKLKYEKYFGNIISRFFFNLTAASEDVALTFFFKYVFFRKKSFFKLFKTILELLKPPFVVNVLTVPKKFKKKLKKRYIIKVSYKKTKQRTKLVYKQLYYYSNTIKDVKFYYRLYKAVYYTFLE